MNSCASFFTLHSELQKQKAWVEAVCLQHCSNVKLCVTDDPAWITQVACVLWCCHGVTAVLGPLPCHSFSKTNVGNGEMTEIDLFLVHLYQNYLTSKITVEGSTALLLKAKEKTSSWLIHRCKESFSLEIQAVDESKRLSWVLNVPTHWFQNHMDLLNLVHFPFWFIGK